MREIHNSHARRYESVVHMLHATCERATDRQALVVDDQRLNYAQYLRAVTAFASELKAYNVAGQRVATVLANGVDTCVASFAVWMAGAQLVPLNPLYTERELRDILNDAEPTVLIFDESIEPIFDRLRANTSISHHILTGARHRDLSQIGQPQDSTHFPLPRVDQPALLQYTGGTTGRAKGVNLTHGAIAWNVYQRECALPTADYTERILCVMPLFHAYGFSMGLLLAVDCAGSLIIRKRYQPDDLLAQFAAEDITIFPGAPTIYNGLVSHPQFAATDFSSLNTCYSGSAPLSVDTMERWTAVTDAPIYEGYGQTEAGPILTFNQVGRPIKPGTVGEAVVDTEIALFDSDSSERIKAKGVVGEIRARGPQLMQNYRGLPAETKLALRDGWLHTGDLGEFDDDGYLIIRDRLKDMVIVSGYNVYPREIDEVLFMHSAVLDAATVGAPDSYRGEVIRAWVVVAEDYRQDVNATVEMLTAHCRENLARYKCPVSIEILDTLPKTTVNKTDKTVLREWVVNA